MRWIKLLVELIIELLGGTDEKTSPDVQRTLQTLVLQNSQSDSST